MQAGKSHCFNAQCGYVHLNPSMPVDEIIEPVSSYGGKQFVINLSIVRVCMTIFFLLLIIISYKTKYIISIFLLYVGRRKEE